MKKRVSLGVLAMAPFLVACSSRTSIPPTELPSLTKSMERFPDGYHYVKQRNGETATLRGKVDRIEIVAESGNVYTFAPPVKAERSEDHSKLVLMTPSEGYREYPLPAIQDVRVVHGDTEARDYAIGLPLTAGSIPFFVMGALFLSKASEGSYYKGLGYIVGGGAMAAGLGMAIPGLYFTLRSKGDPRRVERSAAAQSEPTAGASGWALKPASPASSFVGVTPLGISGAF